MQNNEFEKYDIKVKEHLLKCLETTSNDIERQIIEY